MVRFFLYLCYNMLLCKVLSVPPRVLLLGCWISLLVNTWRKLVSTQPSSQSIHRWVIFNMLVTTTKYYNCPHWYNITKFVCKIIIFNGYLMIEFQCTIVHIRTLKILKYNPSWNNNFPSYITRIYLHFDYLQVFVYFVNTLYLGYVSFG